MAHVPKFGDWESENIPYTTYFENARKDKGTGAKMINPNDPEENPDAFMFRARASNHESETRLKQRVENLHAPESHHAVRAPPFQATSDKGMYVTKQEHEKHSSREEEDVFHADHRVSLDTQRNRNHKSGRSQSGSDKSSSDYSLLKNHRRAERSSQSRTSVEGSNSFPPALNTRVDEIPQRMASVPKFGSWDETDPRSGEGFTVIFNKVKEEKQNGASRFSTAAATTIHPNSGHKNNHRSKSRSKKCCGLF